MNTVTLTCDPIDANAIDGVIEALDEKNPPNWATDEARGWLQKIVDAARNNEAPTDSEEPTEAA